MHFYGSKILFYIHFLIPLFQRKQRQKRFNKSLHMLEGIKESRKESNFITFFAGCGTCFLDIHNIKNINSRSKKQT